jgi:hypothetical protein
MTGSGSSTAARDSELRKGDVVEVRSPAEILATLDEDGSLDGVLFMPEMLQFLGGRYTVSVRVERACDTISYTGARKMPDTVLLDDLRCDGGGHDGCQAGCRLYWKEAWLKRVPAGAAPAPTPSPEARLELERHVLGNTKRKRSGDDRSVEVYRCQATEFLRATQPLGWYDPKSYIRELTCGNIGFWRWLEVTTRAFFVAVGRRLGMRPPEPFHPRAQPVVATAPLDLKPGEPARIRSKAEIERTLDPSGKTRGLAFDREMLPYCGHTYGVKRRVERFIDETTGEMIELKTDALILEGVICRGFRSENRWFCPRAIYPWWREAWLDRVDAEQAHPPGP